MVEFKTDLSISNQCKLLNINRSNLYYNKVGFSEESLHLMKLLVEQYHKTPFYGYRKLTVLYQQQGFCVNEKRIRKLMKVVN